MWEVNLRKNEWNKLQKNIEKYHEDMETDIANVIRDIRQLLENDNYFNVDQTTKSLLQLLSTVESEIMPLMEATFQSTEQSIETAIKSFNNIDTFC